MPGDLQTVIESEVYLRTAERLMTEAERAAVVDVFAANPQVGDVIPGTGGLRKVRVPLAGRGKRGGTRVISCFVGRRDVYLLLDYAKDEQANPTPEQARILARLVETLS
ncbi:type II toxin-antitoxin system RelE/ParE family toxin [Methylobacterium indicum]|uniref:RelE cytotoxic translational repressor of toxin-antitoxin stability system n=1 Tax=Methylobacterium indicum TaxID=1775910 RepID=A0ABR5H6E6_9HYPH|nr:type II toxin-antitoxin system RelE/ParE family toxin [Methylobacterium indicum]KMO17522.1 RelE cytotoxic translational repressor of toxin-antitoxin stability system [Methylobacterium indicum]KMO19868.1 RelE cytotoxic translational repressor of toxin-antitoxin stability system [Methylobacterium indicum]